MRSVNLLDAELFSADRLAASWRTSSRCSHGECIEVGAGPAEAVAVRDTKNRDTGPSLVFAPTAWRSFIADVKHSGAAR
jgi:hypothetical protein